MGCSALPGDFSCLKSRTADGRKNPNQETFSDLVRTNLRKQNIAESKKEKPQTTVWDLSFLESGDVLLSQVIFPACIPHCGRQEKS